MIRITFLLPTIFIFFLLMVVPVVGAAPVVLFDQAHGQRFLVEENRPLALSGLARIFADHGGKTRTSTALLSASLLQDVDILIISGPFLPVRESEVSAVMEFVNQGGRLAVMAHISSPLEALLERLGMRISTRPVSEQENVKGNNPRDFKLTRLGHHPLTRDLAGIDIYGGWALLDKDKKTTAIAMTSDEAWVDLNGDGRLNKGDAMQPFAMVLAGKSGKGSFAVFGDDAIFQNQFLTGSNRKLAENLARWFIGDAGGELI